MAEKMNLSFSFPGQQINPIPFDVCDFVGTSFVLVWNDFMKNESHIHGCGFFIVVWSFLWSITTHILNGNKRGVFKFIMRFTMIWIILLIGFFYDQFLLKSNSWVRKCPGNATYQTFGYCGAKLMINSYNWLNDFLFA